MSTTPKAVVKIVLIAALVLPIAVYAFRVVGHRSEEIRRYHQEMVAVEKELRHSLDALGAIVISASQLNKDKSIPDLDQAGELLSRDRVFLERSIVWVAEEAQSPISSCIIRWETNVNNLKLHFTTDWQIGATNTTEDVRLRYGGHIDIGRVLEDIGKVTNFDALLVADENGNLVQRFGPDADNFSALPSYGEAETGNSSEGDRADPATLFLPVAKTVNREIAGRRYTIFPRNLALPPGVLENDPLHCRAKPGEGHEFARLRVVGLVGAERLATLSIRPSETAYWCGVFYYGLVTFLFIELRRPKRITGVWLPRPLTWSWYVKSLTGWITVLGFGLVLGIYAGAGWLIHHHNQNIDRQLRLILEESYVKTSARIAGFHKAFGQPWGNRWCSGLARCADIGQDGWMTRYDFGTTELQPRNVFDRQYFKVVSSTDKVFMEPVISRATGLREIVVAKGMESCSYRLEPTELSVRSITSSLIHFGEQVQRAQFGMAFAEAKDGRWEVFLSSESNRQASQDFLRQFSDADCLQIRVKESRGGFCSGLLYGRKARLLVRPAAGFHPGRPGTDEAACFDIGCASASGHVILISYFFEDLSDARFSATFRATSISGLLVLVVLGVVIFLMAMGARSGRSLTGPSAWRKFARRLDLLLDTNLWYRASLLRICALTVAFSIGLTLVMASWAIEDHWQHRLAARDFELTNRTLFDRCQSAFGKNVADVANCLKSERQYLVVLNETRENDGSSVFGDLASEAYLALRPVRGRFAEIIPAFDRSLANAEDRLLQESFGRPLRNTNIASAARDEDLLPNASTIYFLLCMVLAGSILLMYLVKPTWLRSVLVGHTISTSAMVTLAALGLLMVVFKHELMVALIALLGTLDKVHQSFESVASKILTRTGTKK